MAITIQLFFAHPGFIFTTVYRQMFHTRVWNILWYTINFAINFWGKCIILGEYNIGANAIRPYNYPPVSVGAYRIRPFAYTLSHTPKITLLQHYM